MTADKAINKDHDQFSHTKRGIGEYWTASFNGVYNVTEVRILNRLDNCGERLANALVQVDDQEFGTLPVETQEGKWYVVKPTSPMKGSSIKVSTTTN